MKDMSVQALCALTASDSPVPGGGSVSALAGAYGAALLCMVSRLTIGKRGYEDVWGEMADIIEKAEAARTELLNGIQKDAEAFDAVMVALSMPKNGDEEKTTRAETMQKALKNAAAIPYSVAARALELMELTELAVRRGNRNAVTDGLVAAMLCRAAVLGAVLNVRINLVSIKDMEYAAEMRDKCAALEQRAAELEASVFALAPELS